MQKIDTGAIGMVAVPYPRPGPVGKGRGAVNVKPGLIALHEGETEEGVRAFAAHLCAVWTAYLAKHEQETRLVPSD